MSTEIVASQQSIKGTVAGISQVANTLKDFIRSNQLTTNFRGKEHVNVEAWEFLYHIMGLSPITVSTEKLEDESIKAVVELIRDDDGMVVGRADACCGGPKDANWKSRGDEVCTSMAITRAVGKIGRMKYGFVMKLAGYEATPAEEMPAEMKVEQPQEPTPENPIVDVPPARMDPNEPTRKLVERSLQKLRTYKTKEGLRKAHQKAVDHLRGKDVPAEYMTQIADAVKLMMEKMEK
jgi:hypothetical protein